MPIATTIVSGDRVAVGSPAQIPCLIGPAPDSVNAPVGSVLSFDPGMAVTKETGQGLSADVLLYMLRQTSGRVLLSVCAATWSPAPSFTHLDAGGGTNPSGPDVTCSLAPGQPGCLDDHNLRMIVQTPGGLGTAMMGLSYDGGDPTETFPIPPELSASLVGGDLITPTTLAQVSGTTLVFDQPGSKTITMPAGSLAAAPAGVMDPAATITGGSTYTSSSWKAGAAAALAANPRKLVLTSAGATPAHVPASLVLIGADYAGATINETVTPATTLNGAVLTTNVFASLTSASYASAGGTDATLQIGYEDAYASAAEVAATATEQAEAAPLAVAFFDSQSAAGHRLGFATTAVGAGAQVTLDASAGTAAILFGFANGSTANGSPSTYTLPASGLVLTFAGGTYALKETYSAPCVGPRASVAQRVAAATAAGANFNNAPFGFFVDTMPVDTAANCAALTAAYDTIRATALTDPNQPRDIYFGVASPWHVADPNPATNQTNITAADAALLAAFTGAAACPESVAVDDVYIPGASVLALGSFRRAAAIAWGVKRATAPRVAATAAEGSVPEASLVAGDGRTLARDNNSAFTKLDGLAGPGFFALKTDSTGTGAKFALGANRSGRTSRLRHDGDFAVCCEVARLVQALVGTWEGKRPETDPSTGMLSDHARSSLVDAVDGAIRSFLKPDANGANVSGLTSTGALNNCTDFTVVINDPASGKFVDNGIMPIVVTITTLGTVQQVNILIAATGTTITPANSNASAAAA